MDASQRPASPHSSGEYQVVGNKRSLPPSPPPKRSSSVESGAISALSSGRALTIHKKAHTAVAQPQRSAIDDVDQKSVVNLASVPNASAAAVQRNDLRQAVLNGADLRGADLRGALLESSLLAGAQLDGVQRDGIQLEGADLGGAELPTFNPPAADR